MGADRDISKTAVLGRQDLEDLATRSVRAPTEPPPLARGSSRNTLTRAPTGRRDAGVPLAINDCKTERMRAKHFHQLLDAGDAMPITPELLESIDWHSDGEASDEDMAIPRDPEAVLDELAALGAPTAADLAVALPGMAAPERRRPLPRSVDRWMLIAAAGLFAIALALALIWLVS